jgi:ABC-type molybdate transport system substrate-binding protein
MDYPQKAGLIADSTRKDLIGNQLVLVAASDAKPAPASRHISIWQARLATASLRWPILHPCRRENMATPR